MVISVRLIGALRHISGKKDITVPFMKSITVKDLIYEISEQAPQLKKTFCNQELNEPKSNALILVNGVEISALKGYETLLNNGDEVVFIPVVHGG